MSKLKDATFTGQEPNEPFEPDPEYDEQNKDNSQTVAGEIYKLIPKIMASVGPVAKSQVNTQFKGQAIEDIYNALNKSMSRHGVFTTSKILDYKRDERQTPKGATLLYTILRISYTFWAPDGSSVHTETQGEGMDMGDKSANKAMSAAHKYALKQVFLIPTEGEDPDRESHEVAPKHAGFTQGYDKRQAAQGPQRSIVDAIMACEDIKTLQEMWSKIEHKAAYESHKESRKKTLLTMQADEDQKNL